MTWRAGVRGGGTLVGVPRTRMLYAVRGLGLMVWASKPSVAGLVVWSSKPSVAGLVVWASKPSERFHGFGPQNPGGGSNAERTARGGIKEVASKQGY
ncbi:hypothetical protein PAHAL_1G181000 [Panicum hallii]|jgi:hypothetical protein|uniref:Uncharacterized protein n=1 Tax=Panicum hallii TaxID=206008 RepID=A0A2T8KVQ6_9POAL|nr:hypothetical protein PAHAL_1G181000 [Panicum hallii]